MKYFLIDDGQLNVLKHVAKRLYAEQRMNGDDMRDAAHAVSAVVHVCEQLEQPEAPATTPEPDELVLCESSWWRMRARVVDGELVLGNEERVDEGWNEDDCRLVFSDEEARALMDWLSVRYR